MKGQSRSLGFVFLVVFLPAALMAENRAMLYPSEGVSVNGKAVSRASTVFSGDSIETGKGSAQIVGPGLSIQMEPGSSLAYGAPMRLGCGSISVSGEGNVMSAGETITASSPTKFQVVNRGGTVMVSVQSGAVRLRGNGSRTLQAGQSASHQGSTDCPVMADAAKFPAKSHAKVFALAGAAGAGAAGAAISAATRKESPVSPTRP